MKTIILYISILCLPIWAGAQSIQDFVKALKNNNISYVNQQLDNTVEITHEGKSNALNKSQASKYLTDFFAGNKISDFKLLHQSESGNTTYFIGSMSTSGGNYRTTFFARNNAGKLTLQEIRFEKQ